MAGATQGMGTNALRIIYGKVGIVAQATLCDRFSPCDLLFGVFLDLIQTPLAMGALLCENPFQGSFDFQPRGHPRWGLSMRNYVF